MKGFEGLSHKHIAISCMIKPKIKSQKPVIKRKRKFKKLINLKKK